MIYLVFLAFHYWSIALWRLGRSRFFAGMPFLVGAILLFVRNSGSDVEAYEQSYVISQNLANLEAIENFSYEKITKTYRLVGGRL